MKKILSTYLIATGFITAGYAQVPQKIVVEHFTNTVCGVCANRNPGFYTNLNSQSGALHLAIHPSSPYNTCALNLSNVAENDARTNYYGIYGSTPRLVIQGSVISSSANYSSSSIFTPYQNQTTPASIRIVQTKFGSDSIRAQVIIKTETTHSLGNLSLFVALAEDTVFYTGPNGEAMHFDVFRKSLTGTSGITVNLPANVGDSIVYTMSSPSNSAWMFSHIYTMAILQDSANKSVVQAEAVPASSNTMLTGINSAIPNDPAIRVFYSSLNGQNLIVQQEENTSSKELLLYAISGKLILTVNITSNQQQVNLGTLSEGIYVYALKSKGVIVKSGKVVVN